MNCSTADTNVIKKVLILYTGGTIGMDYTKDGLSIVPGLFASQLNTLPSTVSTTTHLIEYPNLIDSSDISINNWVQIIKDISSNYGEYDGFIIIHGTDTMAYTASVLAFALKGLHKPVILTGSQLPLVHRRSDGWNNVIDAIYSAIQPDLHEVAIVFNNKLFRGCRAQKISTNRFIAFDSLDEEPLAEFGIEIIWHKKRWLQLNSLSFSPILPKKVNVLDLCLCPGYTTDFIADTLLNNTDIAGVVLQTYGGGTIPMHYKLFTRAIKAACERGVIIVSVTQVIEGNVASDYVNSHLSDLGVIAGHDMTPEAAFAKLLILLSTNIDANSIKEALSKSLVGELTESL